MTKRELVLDVVVYLGRWRQDNEIMNESTEQRRVGSRAVEDFQRRRERGKERARVRYKADRPSLNSVVVEVSVLR